VSTLLNGDLFSHLSVLVSLHYREKSVHQKVGLFSHAVMLYIKNNTVTKGNYQCIVYYALLCPIIAGLLSEGNK